MILAFGDNSVGAILAPWQTAIKTAIRSGVELCRRLELPATYESAALAAEKSFSVFAPLSYVSRMRAGDPHDPLLRQVLPLGEELVASPGFTDNPVGDAEAERSPGLLQKYSGRVLLITTGACAVHCRYCFRRHYPYYAGPPARDKWQSAVAEIRADPTVEELLLSGGDPLTIADDRLADLVEQLADIPHLRRVRVHTRLPIVIPQRVTDQLIRWLQGTRLMSVFVVHANHPQELDSSVASALGQLVAAGIPVLNQSVLLRGVNDDADTLVDLSRRLLDCRVLPYYLHQLDRVQGAAHFEVSIERGRQLMGELHARLPGYAVPRYVQELPGEVGKRWLA